MLKRLIHAFLIGAGSAAIALALSRGGLLDRIECAIWSWPARWLARPSEATSRVRLIVIDQASLDWAYGKDKELAWPWPRQVYAPILAFCKRSGARVAVFDMIFEQERPDDDMFGGAIAAGPPFVGALSLSRQRGDEAWPGFVARKGVPVEGFEAWAREAGPEAAFDRVRCPVPAIAKPAALLGNVIEEPDRDGIIRRVHLLRNFRGSAVPSLALAACLAGEDRRLRVEPGALHVGDRTIPIDGEGAAILRFRGPAGTHPRIRACDIIESELAAAEGRKPPVAPEELRDCFVFLIPTAAATVDLKATPVGTTYPGGEVQATALDNLLAGDFLRETPFWLAALATLVLCVLAAFIAVMPSRHWHAALAFSLFLPLPIFLGFEAYGRGLWWPMAAQEIAVFAALAGATLLNYFTEGRQKRFIRGAFQQYLSPEFIQRLVDHPAHLRLGGERRDLTLFFSDIESFSSFSERLDPKDLTALLNDFLTDMTDIIMDEGGTLDKYVGDAIVAFWNAPVDQPDHALRAVRASLKCQRRLAERRPEYKARYAVDLKMRIGLNSGPVVVGNMGSHRRFNYTILGDAANLASRLEGANKALGTYIMVAESTWAGAGGVVGRELGQLRVVGRKTPVKVFEPLALPGEAPDAEFIRKYESGLALCAQAKWAEALAAFEGLPNDAAARKYAEKCRALASGAETEWDGVWNLSSK